MRSRPKGMTLLELVIVFGLLGTLLAMVALYFTRGQQYVSETEAFLSLQREGFLTLRKIKDPLMRTTDRHLQTDPDRPDYIAFLSYLPLTDSEPLVEFDAVTTQVIWKSWQSFSFDPESGEVIQASLPLTPRSSDLSSPPSPAVSVATFAGLPPSQRKAIGRRVGELEFTFAGDSVLVTLLMATMAPVPSRSDEDRRIELDLKERVLLVN